MSPPDGGDHTDLAEAIRAAQEEMARAVQLGGLTNDPIRYTFGAMSAHLGASLRIAEDIRASAGIGARGLTPEGEKALVERVSSAVAVGADERAARPAGAHNRRTVVLVAVTLLGVALVAAASGWWAGRDAGRAEAAATAADLRAEFADGAEGAAIWRDLIKFNREIITRAAAHCEQIADASGRPACSFAFWTGPALPAPAKPKR